MSEIKKFTVDFLKVVADQTRLDILNLLQDSELSSSEIQNKLQKSQSTISQHLKILDNNNLITIEPRKEAKKLIKYYSIKNHGIFKLLSDISSFVVKINREKLVDLRDLDVADTLL